MYLLYSFLLIQARAGAFGSFFWIDPVNNVTWVGMYTGSPIGGGVALITAAKAIYDDLNRASKVRS
jgi:CubicO group peptidase (beta-lactamase class C family)